MMFKPLLIAALLSLAACADARAADPLTSELTQLAKRGNAEAHYHLGMAHWVGAGASKDPAKALDHFRKAAAGGDPLGAYKLGCLYDGQGSVLPRDAGRALQYKLVAAKAGYALAQQDVAALYAQRDELQPALMWIERAAAQGTPDALATYASIYNGAPGVAPDPVKTAAYFRLFLARADAGDAQRNWLKEFEAKLTADQRRRADALVSGYRPNPTPLTIKALRGMDSAKALVRSN